MLREDNQKQAYRICAFHINKLRRKTKPQTPTVRSVPPGGILQNDKPYLLEKQIILNNSP